ncbi:MAG TPA: hypothetical protein VFU68_08180, partial [Terracidiphilus sp.]|nr:hypothetical protein [Terracidiphilus sp.]
ARLSAYLHGKFVGKITFPIVEAHLSCVAEAALSQVKEAGSPPQRPVSNRRNHSEDAIHDPDPPP